MYNSFFTIVLVCSVFTVSQVWWAFFTMLGWAASCNTRPSVLSKGVEISLTATQFGPACVQTIPHLLGAYLRQTKPL